jgi:hypothetical protein
MTAGRVRMGPKWQSESKKPAAGASSAYPSGLSGARLRFQADPVARLYGSEALDQHRGVGHIQRRFEVCGSKPTGLLRARLFSGTRISFGASGSKSRRALS